MNMTRSCTLKTAPANKIINRCNRMLKYNIMYTQLFTEWYVEVKASNKNSVDFHCAEQLRGVELSFISSVYGDWICTEGTGIVQRTLT
jgi:hypothetical protein